MICENVERGENGLNGENGQNVESGEARCQCRLSRFRMYLRKNDMDEPPRFDEDGDDEVSGRRLKHHTKRYEDPLHLQERFYRLGELT